MMSRAGLKKELLHDAVHSTHQAVEAYRIATESTQQQLQHQGQQQREQERHRSRSHRQVHRRAHPQVQQHHQHGLEGVIPDNGGRGQLTEANEREMSDYDLKSKDSKYKRWSPKMDLLLIKLLSDVVHSYPKGEEVDMTKKAWAYVTGQLRAVNPETVYSTYTKYSCQQHLLNVNHHRYKVWYILMLHAKSQRSGGEYSYRWSPEAGRFQIFLNPGGAIIHDERQVKSLLYSDGLSLPSLTQFNKGNLILNDLFLTDHLKYMTTYHNEVLPLLIRLDSRYAEGLGDIYHEIPKFEIDESPQEYYRPLASTKLLKVASLNESSKDKKRSHHTNNHQHEDVSMFDSNLSSLPNGPEGMVDEDTVDPVLKRSRSNNSANHASNTNTEFESVLASAAIAAINSPSVSNGHEVPPIYIKDRKWFNRLINLRETGHITSNEVLSVCEGVREGKIPLFMLNILDSGYYPSRDDEMPTQEETSNEETAKKVREYILPMIISS